MIKKVIAREFLIFLLLIISGSLIFICVFPYNSYQESRIKKANKSLNKKEKLYDSLLKPVNNKIKKQEWFIEELRTEYGVINSKNGKIDELWKTMQSIVENDSVEYRWNETWEKKFIDFHKNIGFNNPKELTDFIKQNSMNSKDSVLLEKSKTIISEKAELNTKMFKSKNNIFNDSEMKNLAIRIGIVLFAIIFLLRYLIYAIKWSLKTLKES